MESKLIIIDGNNWVNRAHFSMSKLRTTTGIWTGATFGFRNMLKVVMDKYSTKFICVCFDRCKNTHRHKLYDKYKANRDHDSIDKKIIRKQTEYIDNLLKFLGISTFFHEDFEADDIIYTICKDFSEYFNEILIMSSDKDLFQIVSSNIRVVDTRINKIFDRQSVIDKLGVSPEFVIDYLSIVGDKSDNIPGCPGIGKVNAVKLINQYGNIKSIVNKLGSKFMKDLNKTELKFLDHFNMVKLSRELVKLKYIDELQIDFDSLKITNVDDTKLQKLYDLLEFRRN